MKVGWLARCDPTLSCHVFAHVAKDFLGSAVFKTALFMLLESMSVMVYEA
jgi:hypothetical protein